MAEYPWDIENMMLEQHKQPCDCAICDDIQIAQLSRRKRREAVERGYLRPTMAEFTGLNRDEQIAELKAEVAQVTQTAINFHDAWSKYRDALNLIARMGISGLGYQADYEKCVNIAKEALEI